MWLFFAAGVFQVTKEVTLRINYQQIILAIKRIGISPQAPIERIELGILIKCCRENCSGLSIAITAYAFGITIGICFQHCTLTISICANNFGLLFTFGTIFTRFLFTISCHPRKY